MWKVVWKNSILRQDLSSTCDSLVNDPNSLVRLEVSKSVSPRGNQLNAF
jgi:hypothetical protein